jgi:DNA-binding transcriptional LysR family regulator
MDLELLRTFLEVSRTRHFGQAADALHLTQAAVSARVKQLESLLGVRLFDRYKRDIRLTPEGNRLLRYADLMLAEWRKARQDVTAGGAAAQLSVGGGVRLWDVLLQDWLHRLRRARPQIALIAESHSPELLTRKLLDGVLDLAFMLEPPQLEVLQIREVARLKLVLVADRQGLLPEQALGEGYLMVDWGLAHALTHRRLFPDAPEPHTRLAKASMALAYIRELGGAAYLPLSMLRDDLNTGVLHPVAGAPVIEHAAHAVFPVRSPRIGLIDEVLSLFDPMGPAAD